MKARLDELFITKPKAELVLKAVEPFRAAIGIALDHFERGHDVLFDGKAAEDARLLRQVADAEAGAAEHRQAGDIVPVQRDAPGIGPHEAHDHIKGCRFAGAVGTQQADDFAAADRDRDAPHHGALAVGLADGGGDQAAGAFENVQLGHGFFAPGLAGVAAGFVVPPVDGGCASFGTIRPWTRPPGAAVMWAMPVFIFTSAAGPLIWVCPWVMRTAPTMRAMPVSWT